MYVRVSAKASFRNMGYLPNPEKRFDFIFH